MNRRSPVIGGSRWHSWVIVVALLGSEGSGIPLLKAFLVDLVIRICGLPLSKYIYFTLLGNVVWLHIVNLVVSAPILHVMVFLVVYLLITLEISKIDVTTFCRRFIHGGCVPRPAPGFLFPYP